MTPKVKRQRGVQVDCTCKRARHEHGTYGAYARDMCGCDACMDAGNAYFRDWRQKRAMAAEEAARPVQTPGQFIATFPYYGGWSKKRIRRAGALHARQLATEQGIELTGPLSLRLDPTPAGGWLLIVQGPATITGTPQEVTTTAQHFAYAHDTIAPHLSAWADQHTREAAALAGQGREGVAA